MNTYAFHIPATVIARAGLHSTLEGWAMLCVIWCKTRGVETRVNSSNRAWHKPLLDAIIRTLLMLVTFGSIARCLGVLKACGPLYFSVQHQRV